MDVHWSMWWTIGVVAGGIAAALILLDILLIWRSRKRTSTRTTDEDTGASRSRREAFSDSRDPEGNLVPSALMNERDRQLAEQDARARERQQRVQSYRLREVSPEDSARYRERWQLVQQEYVANPRDAVSRADELVVAAMIARGYPGASDAAERSEDLSVADQGVADSYSWAHRVSVLANDGGDGLNDEDLRTAMLHYRRVFDALVPAGGSATSGPPSSGTMATNPNL